MVQPLQLGLKSNIAKGRSTFYMAKNTTVSYFRLKRTRKTETSLPMEPLPIAKKLSKPVSFEDRNRNNQDGDAGRNTANSAERKQELPLAVQIQLIVLALQKISDPKGSTLKDIRRFLATAGVIEESTEIRQAMIVALKLGVVARPVWAVKAGLYGRYVLGDGIPIFAGRKSRPKQVRHRSNKWISSSSSSSTNGRKRKRGSIQKPSQKRRNRRKQTNSRTQRLQRKRKV